MPPAADSYYFPALDKCLAGDARLISWNTALRALSDEETVVENTHLEQFFTDGETISVLSNGLEPFPKSSARSASDFDTKTAPIQVSQTTIGDYSLDELKKDAKWLSAEVQIEELVALRLAIVERQERAADQLLIMAANGSQGGLARTDLARSLTSQGVLNTAMTGQGVSTPSSPDFADANHRQRRLLETYVSEKEAVMNIISNLVCRSAVSRSELQMHDVGSLREHAKKSWIDSLATDIAQNICSSANASNGAAFLLNCIQKASAVLRTVEDVASWPVTFTENDDKAQTYIRLQASEFSGALRLLLANLYAFDGVPNAATVQAWFLTMNQCSFLRESSPHLSNMETLQLLVSVISVEILKPQLVTGEIMRSAGIDTPAVAGNLYIKDDRCVRAVNDLLHSSVIAQNRVATPAIYAWSIITYVVRDIALIHKEVWESRHDGGPDSPRETRRGSRGPRSDIETLYSDNISIREWESLPNGTPGAFAAAAVDHLTVFGFMIDLNNVASSAYTSNADSDVAFICKESLLDLVREGLPFVQYEETVLDTILSILTPTDSALPSQKHVSVLASKVLYDADQLRPMIIDTALARYPYELSPLLRLFTTLANAESRSSSQSGVPEVVRILDNLESFTQYVPVGFKDFQLVNEELNENDMVLTEDLPVFVLRASVAAKSGGLSLANRQNIVLRGDDAQSLTISSNTPGRIVKESQPWVLKLEHRHSALEYLGVLLSTLLPGTGLTPYIPYADLDRITAADIVALCTSLLNVAMRQQDGHDEANAVIMSLSRGLWDESDIILIVAEILETELLAHSDHKTQEGSYELLVACIEFLDALVKISPERVWSHLGRSSLLGVADGSPAMVAVINGTEVQRGQFRFLSACAKLHASILDNAIAGLVKRRAQTPKMGNRFATAAEPLDWTSDRIMSSVLSAYQNILLNAFQHLPEVRFQFQQERCEINICILESFLALLSSTYGLSVFKKPSSRLTNVLAPAASALLCAGTPTSSPGPLLSTFVRLLSDASAVASNGLPDHFRILVVKQTKAACQFLTLLLRATKSGIDLSGSYRYNFENTPQLDISTNGKMGYASVKHSPVGQPSQERARLLSSDLLQSMPLFASLLASEHCLKESLYVLLAELVSIYGSGDTDPPSILAQLGPDAQKSLLVVVTQLDRPLCDVAVERKAWDFLSSILSSRQQWFAIYLLTGELPKQRGQCEIPGSVKAKPILGHALDELSQISLLAPERAIGMLKFVATAQETWAWTTTTLRSHPDFIRNTLAWIETLGPATRDMTPGSSIICAKECVMASLLCDILAMSIHAGMETGDRTIAKHVSQKLAFLRDHGVAANTYNRSLHKNLADNMKRKYAHSELSDFQRTEVNPDSYGTEFFYDRAFAARVLSHDPAWYGPLRSKIQGFSDEFARANANLSLLDGQTKLLRSWKTLATTLCESAEQDPALQSELARVAENCLLANVNPQLDEPNIANVLDLRLELAFVITSRLVASRVQSSAAKALLPAAWELVRTSPVDFDVATAPEDIRYYRELVQVLYLSIQPHIHGGPAAKAEEKQLEYLAPAVASVLVSIVGKVIAPNFRALCENIHNDVALALPGDFALITALLQAVLSVPGVASVYTLLSDLVAGSAIVRGALSLFSWADQLSDVTGQDPIYGEVAVMFLLALSSVRPIAEQMALDGVFTNLSSANLSNYFRKPGGKGPFDDPPRMFVIWTEGFLPLCLNLLDSVGPPIAGEVAGFLNSFPEQLRRAETSLQNEAPSVRNPRAGSVTLGLISEAQSLSMIAIILSSDIARGAADGINAADIPSLEFNHEAVQTLVEALTRSKRSLNDRITAVTPLEEKWLNTPVNVSGDNLLRAKVLKELESMAQCLGGSHS